MSLDENGDPDGAPARATLAGAFTAPRTSDDTDDRGREGAIIGLTLFLPYAADVEATDGIEVDGDAYRIVGAVEPWKNPLTGWEAGQSVKLVRAAG